MSLNGLKWPNIELLEVWVRYGLSSNGLKWPNIEFWEVWVGYGLGKYALKRVLGGMG